MLDVDNKDIINTLMGDLQKNKRKTQGRDQSKNYHKVTISINQQDKDDLMDYAQEHNIGVSKLIKDLLREKGILK